MRYEEDDYSLSFCYESSEFEHHRAWLCFGPLEVAVSCVNGQLLGVSGYRARRIWVGSPLSPFGPILSGALVFEGFGHCQAGVGYTMQGVELEAVKFNSKSGWAHVGDASAEFDILVEFATNCCAAICDQRVVALWIHPENWRELV